MKEGRVTYGFPEQMTGSAAVLEKKKKEKKKSTDAFRQRCSVCLNSLIFWGNVLVLPVLLGFRGQKHMEKHITQPNRVMHKKQS